MQYPTSVISYQLLTDQLSTDQLSVIRKSWGEAKNFCVEIGYQSLDLCYVG